jgi:hypothetical protein
MSWVTASTVAGVSCSGVLVKVPTDEKFSLKALRRAVMTTAPTSVTSPGAAD